jgi:hypothetical protein
MRWLWLVLSIACFAVTFRTHSMGLAALCLLAALVFILLATLAFVAARIEQRSRNEATMISGEDLRRMREQIERRKQEGDAGTATAAAGGASTSGRREPADFDAGGDGGSD